MLSKPLLIVSAVSLLLVGVLGYLLKSAYEENGALAVKLAGANAVIAQREEDMKLSAQIVAKQAEALVKLDTKVVAVTERIYAAPITRECVASPSMRAATVGVKTIILGDQIPAR